MAERTLMFWDYLVIAVFFATMIGVGVHYSRKSGDSDQFFGGDKTMPWWLSGVSFYMCTFSALAFVMYSALGYKFGFLPITVSWILVPAILIGAQCFAVRWRRVATRSPLEYIETRFGNRMRQGLVWLGLPMRILDDSMKLLAIGTVVGVGLGFPIETGIVVSGVIVIFYTFLGGLKATLVADFIQFFVLFAVVLALPVFCLREVGGLANFVDRAPEGFFDLVAGKYTWYYMFVSFVGTVINRSTSWTLVQRYYSTRSEKDAKRVGYLVALLLFVGPPLFFFPAMAARVFLPGLDVNDPNVMNGVYAIVCKRVLPVGMIGMVVAAMFSATMSTLAGDYNSVSCVLTNDFYVRMLRPGSSRKERMFAARMGTLVAGGLVIALTFAMRTAQGADDLLNLTNKVFALFSCPIGLPMLAGFVLRRLSRRAGFSGMLVGMAASLVAFAVGGWHPALREMTVMTPISFFATVVGLCAGTRLFPDTPEERAAVEAFFRKAETPS
ncbi:MAG: hypothetical protein ACI4RD_11050 [Kiritimatiellia bacterium]